MYLEAEHLSMQRITILYIGIINEVLKNLLCCQEEQLEVLWVLRCQLVICDLMYVKTRLHSSPP